MAEKELRGLQGLELRADGDAGIFTGYIAVWNTVDSYNSTFDRGSFKKTIQERGDRIKVLDDHGKIVGKVTEIREDDHGVWVEGALTMAVERARDVFEHIRAGAIDTLSFGFKTMADKFVKGVRHITEVKLYEVSPVTFAANEAAMIENLRKQEELEKKKEEVQEEEVRADDFDVTLKEKNLNYDGNRLINALLDTLDDIWWYNDDADTIRMKADEAIAAFHAQYLTWINEYLAYYWEGGSEQRTKPCTNELRTAFDSFVDGRTLETIAAESDFTVDELRTLQAGKLLSPTLNGKIATLPEEVRTAYRESRKKLVETLCNEIRTAGFSAPEGERFQALLFKLPEARTEEPDPVVDPLDTLMSAVKNLGT